MSKVTLITVDLAKDVFQIAGFNSRLKNAYNKRFKRKVVLEFISLTRTPRIKNRNVIASPPKYSYSRK